MQLLLTVKTTFGTPVVVGVYPLPTGMDIEKEITVPSLKDGELKRRVGRGGGATGGNEA